MSQRTITSVSSWLVVVFGAVAVVGCFTVRPPAPARSALLTSDPAAVPGARTPQETAAAEAQLGRYLNLAVATRAQRVGMFDSVTACRDDELLREARWLADYRVLSARVNGDSAQGVAVLTTVARQVERDTAYVATLRIAEDTSHWTLIRTAGPDGRRAWMVCGDAREGFNVAMVGRSILWQPDGASADRARTTIDSIRRARGKPILR
jgi:hypothetical protein